VLLAFKIVDEDMARELAETGTIQPLPPVSGQSLEKDEGRTNNTEGAMESLVALEPLRGKPLLIPLGRSKALRFVWVEALGMWVGEYEVTNGQYRRFKSDHDSLFREELTLNEDEQPAVYVSWLDAEVFCSWLNENFGNRLPQGWRFRLPFEREWIVAARCGTDRTYPWGDDWPPAYGNYSDKAAQQAFSDWQGITNYNDGFAVSCPVHEGGTNAWGIYGMAGNVWEWCWDWYDAEGRYKTRHGGSWDFDIKSTLTILYRGFDRPDARYDTIGFRVVISDRGLPEE
jgi:formylglycine-generating enzyme required for sulfatase activity